ncbi:MAG: AraC family transcriptional regulator [Ruminococcaceae bacterium]|nr:AraC family transcriptional regulator [Oscillospiraceae bacterium]
MGNHQNAYREEYEVLAYPRLQHVNGNIVHIINRNAHVHRALELGLVLEGEGVVHLDERDFSISKGSLFFFNSNEPHQILATNQSGIKVAYLQMASSFCSEYLSCFRNLEILENDLTGILTPAQRKELTGLMVQAVDNYMAEDSDLYGLHCICSICQLYSRLLSIVPYRQMTEAAYLARNKKMARLGRITEYIDQNYSEKITLTQLAELEGVTTTYLSHFIHDNLHMTFQEYVSSVRFERALKLLRDTSMCMTDVSVVSGFSDVKYLSRMLETYFGMSAQESCKQLRRETLVLQKSEQEQVQTFASDEQGRSWLEDFWKEYSTLRKEETYE